MVVSTDIEEVAKISHRALVFERGRVVAELSGADLTIANLVAAASRPRHRLTTATGSTASALDQHRSAL